MAGCRRRAKRTGAMGILARPLVGIARSRLLVLFLGKLKALVTVVAKGGRLAGAGTALVDRGEHTFWLVRIVGLAGG